MVMKGCFTHFEYTNHCLNVHFFFSQLYLMERTRQVVIQNILSGQVGVGEWEGSGVIGILGPSPPYPGPCKESCGCLFPRVPPVTGLQKVKSSTEPV